MCEEEVWRFNLYNTSLTSNVQTYTGYHVINITFSLIIYLANCDVICVHIISTVVLDNIWECIDWVSAQYWFQPVSAS